MTKEQVLKVAEMFSIMNAIHDKTLPDAAVLYQARLLADLDFAQVMAAFDEFGKTNKSGKPPTAAHIREAVAPSGDPKLLAIEIARRLDKAVKDHGSSWDEGYWSDQGNYWTAKGKAFWSFQEAVMEELGEIGWKAIQMRGGWKALRLAANEMSEGTFIAQMRDDVMALIANAKAGVDVSRLGMPDHSKPGIEQNKISMLTNSLKTL